MAEDRSDRLKFHLVEESPGAKIKVVGIGGGGGNAINRMIEANIEGVEFIAVNTDVQALQNNLAPIKVQIGAQLTKGLGSGGNPEIGRQAALDDREKLQQMMMGADMVFLTAGLGGGTGTGATPVLASLASEMDILVISIVTLPFAFEGKVRARQAEEGLKELKSTVATVISIPNERLLETVNLDTSIQDAFRLADDVLRQAVQGISDLITKPGLINLDFADVKTIMKGMGMAFMGTGMASGENRAIEAAQKAISSPLLVDTSIKGARGVLINITGGKDLTLHEVWKASKLINELAHPEANIIFGTVIDPNLKDMVKVTVIATGFDRAKDQAFARESKDVSAKKTPPPFPVFTETPPYIFEPKGNEDILWNNAPSSRPWDIFKTPAYRRRPTPNKLTLPGIKPTPSPFKKGHGAS